MALNVLVVDDEHELRESLSQILVGMGHNVLEARNGEEALGIIRERGTGGRRRLLHTSASIHMMVFDVNRSRHVRLEVRCARCAPRSVDPPC